LLCSIGAGQFRRALATQLFQNLNRAGDTQQRVPQRGSLSFESIELDLSCIQFILQLLKPVMKAPGQVIAVASDARPPVCRQTVVVWALRVMTAARH
jgi:hypothetical protein